MTETAASDTASQSSVERLRIAYDAITSAVEALDDGDFSRATRCSGWSIDALLFHVLLDAQRALVVLVDPVDEEPDTDATSYWQKTADREG